MRKKKRIEPVIPASLDLAAMEAMARARVESLCESNTEAQKEVAGEFGFASWKELVAHLEGRVVESPPRGNQGEPVVFEVCFSRSEALGALRKAGLHAEPFGKLWREMMLAAREPVEVPKAKAEVVCPYVRSAYPVNVKVQIVRFGLPTDLRIEVADRAHGERLREELTALAADNAPLAEAERQHTALWGRIGKMLEQSGATLQQVRARQAMLLRKALEALIELVKETPAKQRASLHSLCSFVGKEDREIAARWLISEFEMPDAEDQLGVRIWEVAVPAVAGELIRLIRDPRHGEQRGCLCLALAKTRDKRAAEVIAGVIHEEGLARWAIEALGMLKAKEHAAGVREFVRNSQADVRREAKKTLRKMGLLVETSPKPKHLVKNRRTLPKGLAEWSANLDVEQVGPILKNLGRCMEGFGAQEIAEILAVMEEMSPDQTRAFQFPVRYRDEAADVWIAIFMDDSESPELAVHADAEIISELESVAGELLDGSRSPGRRRHGEP